MTREEIAKLIEAAEAGDIEKVELLSSLFPVDSKAVENLGSERFIEAITAKREEEATKARMKLVAKDKVYTKKAKTRR